MPGLTFNPPEYSFLWIESMHKAEFKIRADVEFDERTARGSIEVRMGAIPVAFITVSIPIDARAPRSDSAVRDEALPYRHIFASYSHKDTSIVRQFENYARGIGDSYMRDVIDLRAGEIWNDRLLEMIDAADVFQLFWSTNSMDSPFIRREWEHALTVNKSNFVRALYWESPFPERDGLPPPELKKRHFASVAIAEPERPHRKGQAAEELKLHVDRYFTAESESDVGGRTILIRQAQQWQTRKAAQARRRTAVILGVLVLIAIVVALLYVRR